MSNRFYILFFAAFFCGATTAPGVVSAALALTETEELAVKVSEQVVPCSSGPAPLSLPDGPLPARDSTSRHLVQFAAGTGSCRDLGRHSPSVVLLAAFDFDPPRLVCSLPFAVEFSSPQPLLRGIKRPPRE